MQPGGFDLTSLKGQHFDATLGILLGEAQIVQFTPQAEQVLVGLVISGKIGFDTGVTVEQAQVGPHV